MLLKLLAIILAVVLIFRLMIRYLLPALGLFVVKKASKNMEEQMKKKTQGERIYSKGDTETRMKSNRTNTTSSAGDDDFVEYEEID